jgi:hypothetical protein
MPVVGAVVNWPGFAIAARWIVSTVSVLAQTEPCTRTPPMHLTSMAGAPGRTVPVRFASAGWKIAWLASSVMSNPFSEPEL